MGISRPGPHPVDGVWATVVLARKGLAACQVQSTAKRVKRSSGPIVRGPAKVDGLMLCSSSRSGAPLQLVNCSQGTP